MSLCLGGDPYYALFRKKKKPPKKKDERALRLKKNANPASVIFCLKPTLDSLTFEGSIAMDMEILENSKNIFLNVVDLTLTKVVWEERETGNRQEAIEMKAYLDKDQLALRFDPFLIPQKGQLRLNFNGPMSEKMMRTEGLFFSKSPIDDKLSYVAGFFHPCGARKCFPSFDEPEFKAEYDMAIIVEKGKDAIGNTVTKARYNHKRDPSLEIVEFKKTPRICTCKLGFIVGTFEQDEMRASEEVVVRVASAGVGRRGQGRFAMSIAALAFPFFSTYFNAPLPLTKLDFVGLPDFQSEAVNCWGLVMADEGSLLASHTEDIPASPAEQRDVALFVTQEVAKQWIGGLVSMPWWNQSPTLAGLTLFLRYVCMQEIHPDFDCSTHFVSEVVIKALVVDGFRSAHPIHTPVSTHSEMEELIVDHSAVLKSACLFRMLYNYVGEAAFREGLVRFVEKFKYRTGSNADLFQAWEEVSGKPVRHLMKSWTSHRNYPLLKAVHKQAVDGKNRFVKVSQEKYVAEGHTPSDMSIWSIPLTLTSERDPGSVTFHTQMDSRATTLVLPDVSRTEWVKLNPGAVGFYRVRYSAEMSSMLKHAIRDKSLEPVDRLNVLDDIYALLLHSGVGSTIELFTTAEAFLEEEDYFVWLSISGIFNKFLSLMTYLGIDDSLRHFGRYLYARVWEKVGFFGSSDEEEGHHFKLLRELVIRMMIKFKHPEVRLRCRGAWDEHIHAKKEEDKLPPEARASVFYGTLSKGDEETVKGFMKLYKETQSVQDKGHIASAFGAVSDSVMVKYVMEFAVGEEVRKVDAVRILIALADECRTGRELAWVFLRDNFSSFKSHFSTELIGKLVTGIASEFGSEDKLMEVSDFFRGNPLPGLERTVALTLDAIRMNDGWVRREKNVNALREYLDADVS